MHEELLQFVAKHPTVVELMVWGCVVGMGVIYARTVITAFRVHGLASNLRSGTAKAASESLGG